mgnify:CR=1 FL=1
MSETKDFFTTHAQEMAKVQTAAPEVVRSFGSFFMTVIKDGALSTKMKELIALGIALSERCEPCIRLHVQKSLEAGATKEEIMEAASVAVLMRGGPAYTHLPMIIETLEMCSR